MNKNTFRKQTGTWAAWNHLWNKSHRTVQKLTRLTLLTLPCLVLFTVISSRIQAQSASATCVYDSLNRLVSVSYSDGTVITYTYDEAGNMTRATVTATRSLHLTIPDGGENWSIGTSQAITWTSTNVTGNVDILISRDAGKTWSTILPATANDGTAAWTVTGPASASCRVRVRSVTWPTIRDDSDTGFAIGDTIPPETWTTSAVCGSTIYTGSATITWSGSDNTTPTGNLLFAYRLDGGIWSAFGAATETIFNGLGPGSHCVEVKARDAAGIEDPTPASCTFTVSAPDTTPPETQITSPVCGTTISTDSVTVSWTGSDNLTPVLQLMYAWNLDSTGWSDYYSNISRQFSGLTAGSHSVSVRARDQAGNVDPSPASCSFTVQLESLPGDVDGDGQAGAMDLVIMLQVASGLLPAGQPPCFDPLAGDFNGNGELDLEDCTILAVYLAGGGPLIGP